jgi:hypothetical protein
MLAREVRFSQGLAWGLAGYLLAAAVPASAQTQPSRPAPSPDPDTAHFQLVAECSTSRTRPRTPREWEALVGRLGFQRNENDDRWSLTTRAGKLRAEAVFQPTQASYWIFFFPVSSDPVPDSILSHWLKDARYTSLDADQLEIGLAPIESLPGGGIRAQNITVSLEGGRLRASRTVVEWKQD